MATLSISGPRRAIETLMAATTCTITETESTPTDDAIDPDTLKPIPGAGDTPTTLYTGPCFWTSTFGGEDLIHEGNAPTELGDGWLFLPSTAPVPSVGAQATITACAHDASLVGLEVSVVSEDLSTLNICRAIRCQTLAAGRPLHGS